MKPSDLELDDKRRAILDSAGHLLIEGGPGCGKTTIALLKALKAIEALEEGQRVLFLSFSRAAVRQITDRMQGLLTRSMRARLEVRTFHAFFLELVRSHGRLLAGHPGVFITPDRAREMEADFDGDKDAWEAECRRMAAEEGRYVFDLLAASAAQLLDGSRAVCDLYSSIYPVVIVDEFQDTSIDQWQAVKALSKTSTVICLADPDQRIFGYLPGVDEERIDHAVAHLQPDCFDLSADNHRSPEGGLLSYANAVLHRRAHPRPESVNVLLYSLLWGAVPCEVRAHEALIALRGKLKAELGREPTIAVLAITNRLVASVSEKISEQDVIGRYVLEQVEHILHWDPELAASAGFVVASILEWPGLERLEALSRTLKAVADYYRTKFTKRAAKTTRATVAALERSLAQLQEGKPVRTKAAKALAAAYDAGLELAGQPVADWREARSRLSGSAELNELFKQVRTLRLLHATDLLSLTLTEAWSPDGSYRDAAAQVRRALADAHLAQAEQDTVPVSLMNMHRSKGKEFDGVVIVEGNHHARLLESGWDDEHVQANRRLLRVAITRARHRVVLVRPQDALPLTPGGRSAT
ncbi:UvrD-helicase domain-containing protein [Streptomyces sp. NPDC058330]|uniref:UvrD-helicase domain-containing protein n=1 Tax=Streptomyces sp. NPDC058330 TaxID=3346449 RepID=UPI0036EEFF12